MIAHTQTIFGNGDAGATPGNCTQAALASLLDLPLDQVPHIVLFHDWYKATKLWLDGRGKKLRIYTDTENTRAYWEHIGVECSSLDHAPSGQMMLACGASHNGPWAHIVVWKGGALVHDTHPNRKGLKGSPNEYWQITDATS
jgi:hypothetical protein